MVSYGELVCSVFMAITKIRKSARFCRCTVLNHLNLIHFVAPNWAGAVGTSSDCADSGGRHGGEAKLARCHA